MSSTVFVSHAYWFEGICMTSLQVNHYTSCVWILKPENEVCCCPSPPSSSPIFWPPHSCSCGQAHLLCLFVEGTGTHSFQEGEIGGRYVICCWMIRVRLVILKMLENMLGRFVTTQYVACHVRDVVRSNLYSQQAVITCKVKFLICR